MLEKIYSVFVSSTYEDLREERVEVQRALLMAKCFPIGMEAFPSTDEETWEFIKRQIEDADFYLLVIAGRYGSADDQGISFTEKEYDYAKEIKKPIIAFVHSDPGSIITNKTDQDDAKRQSLIAFIKKIQSRPLVSRYTTPHELRAQVLLSITNLKETDKTAIGFVRGNQTADLKKYADALEEISKLRSELTLVRIDDGEDFPEAGDEYQVSLSVNFGQVHVGDPVVTTTWGNIFLIIAELLIHNTDIGDYRVASTIAGNLHGHIPEGHEVRFLDSDAIQPIKSKMFARGLVEFETHESASPFGGGVFRNSYHLWRLTENGRIWYRKLTLDR